MKRAPAKRHPDLFEDDGPPIVVPSDQKQGLVRLISDHADGDRDNDISVDGEAGGRR